MKHQRTRFDDQRLLAALAMRDDDVPSAVIARRLGFATGGDVRELMAAVEIDLLASELDEPAPRLTPAPAATRTGPVCAAPGCGKQLQPNTRSGCCRMHNHTQWCRCLLCQTRRRGRG